MLPGAQMKVSKEWVTQHRQNKRSYSSPTEASGGDRLGASPAGGGAYLLPWFQPKLIWLDMFFRLVPTFCRFQKSPGSSYQVLRGWRFGVMTCLSYGYLWTKLRPGSELVLHVILNSDSNVWRISKNVWEKTDHLDLIGF